METGLAQMYDEKSQVVTHYQANRVKGKKMACKKGKKKGK